MVLAAHGLLLASNAEEDIASDEVIPDFIRHGSRPFNRIETQKRQTQY